NGFSLPVQDALQVGRAHAGTVAAASDASTVYHNPAGMTELSGEEMLAGVTVVYAGYDVDDHGSSAVMPGSGGALVPVPGDDGHPRSVAPVPTAFYARPMTVDHDLWLGLALTSPWGLGVEYNDDWFGRYDSIETRLTTVNFSPALAYRIREWISIGAGFNVEYADAKLSSALPNTLAPGGPSAATDGTNRFTGNSIAFGFNVGVLLKPWRHTRIGVHYRSAIQHELSGQVRVRNLTGPLAPGNGRFNADVKLNEPDIVAIGFEHEPLPGTTLFGEAQWFNWSRFNELRVEFSDERPDSVRKQEWQDTWSFYGGIEQRLLEGWTLRAGAGYEPTPTIDRFRNTSLPDGDRVRVGFGVSYDWSSKLRIDFAYAHVFAEREDIDLTQSFFQGAAAGTVTTRARASLFVNDFALRARYRF
ncbi:MAG TPA: outer membrane protein transport protein, partial [Geminicoccaceae bacterium]|nr:outer membrane protein transport protein [Geminicoccaceae bacterium]